jgi:hypothetical protein
VKVKTLRAKHLKEIKARRLAGVIARRRDPLRRRRAVDIEVVLAALRRGWTTAEVALAAGVSHQSVTDRIARYEKRFEPVERVNGQFTQCNTGQRQPWRCAYCNKLQWSAPSRVQQFCSLNCSTLAPHEQSFTGQTIERAIGMRRDSETWAAVARALRTSQQRIQRCIWKYLALRDELTLANVKVIWQQTSDTRPSWKWLERNTGIICTENGPKFDQPSHTGCTAFGHVLRRPDIKPAIEDEVMA